MSGFIEIFGIHPEEVQKTCLLLPFLPKDALEAFGISKLNRGCVFKSASVPNLTIIETGMGGNFVGDAVLYLSKTPCQDIILLGTAGVLEHRKDLHIGKLVTVKESHALDSFSGLITDLKLTKPVGIADPDLVARILTSTPMPSLTAVSFASLYLEDSQHDRLLNLPADIVEMETAALFLAARHTQRRAAALLVISDILGHRRFYEKFTGEEQKSLTAGFDQAYQTILKLI